MSDTTPEDYLTEGQSPAFQPQLGDHVVTVGSNTFVNCGIEEDSADDTTRHVLEETGDSPANEVDLDTALAYDEEGSEAIEIGEAQQNREKLGAMLGRTKASYWRGQGDPVFAVIDRISQKLQGGVALHTLRELLDTIQAERIAELGDPSPKPKFSEPGDDAYPELGRLAVLSEHFLLNQKTGQLVLALNDNDERRDAWTAGLTFGREAPDSDVVGGAAYGVGGSAADALREALAGAGENV